MIFQKVYFCIYLNIDKSNNFPLLLNLNIIWRSGRKQDPTRLLVFVWCTVTFIREKYTEIHIKLTIFLKEKFKTEGLDPNRSTREKCSLFLSSGQTAVLSWEIREDLGRLPTQLMAHLRFTYICLAIQLGFFVVVFMSIWFQCLCATQSPLCLLPQPKGGKCLNTCVSKSISSHTWSKVHYSNGKAKWTFISQRCWETKVGCR